MRKISAIVLFVTALLLCVSSCSSNDGDEALIDVGNVENSFGRTIIFLAADYNTEEDLAAAVEALPEDQTVERVRIYNDAATEMSDLAATDDNNAFGETVILNAEDYNTEAGLSDKINMLLAQPRVERVQVFNNVVETPESKAAEEAGMPHDKPAVTYIVNNVLNMPNSLSEAEFAAVKDKGETVTFNITFSRSSGVSADFGAGGEAISRGVGWNVPASFSLKADSVRWLVPHTDTGGRSVARGQLELRTIYRVKSYDVYATTSAGTSYQGTGTAKKPFGTDFKKVFDY
jgi:hypothetical protein